MVKKEFHKMFSAEGQNTTGFHGQAKLSELNLYKKNFCLAGQTRKVKVICTAGQLCLVSGLK